MKNALLKFTLYLLLSVLCFIVATELYSSRNPVKKAEIIWPPKELGGKETTPIFNAFSTIRGDKNFKWGDVHFVGRYNGNSERAKFEWYLNGEPIEDCKGQSCFVTGTLEGDHQVIFKVDEGGTIYADTLDFYILNSNRMIITPALGQPQIKANRSFYIEEELYHLAIKVGRVTDSGNLDHLVLIPSFVEDEMAYIVLDSESPKLSYQTFGNQTTISVNLESVSPGLYDIALVYNDGKISLRPHALKVLSGFLDDFRIAHLTDIHISHDPVCYRAGKCGYIWEPENEERFSKIISEINEFNNDQTNPPIELAAITGDMVEFSTPGNWYHFRKNLLMFKVPVFTAPGNHDYRLARYVEDYSGNACVPCGLIPYNPYTGYFSFGEDWFNDIGIELYEELINPDRYYSVRYGDYDMLFLNTGYDVLDVGLNIKDPRGIWCNPDGGGIHGAQYNWIQEKITGDRRKFVFLHHSLIDANAANLVTSPCGDPRNNDFQTLCPELCSSCNEEPYSGRCAATINENRINLIELCKNNKALMVLSGHTHYNRVFSESVSGGWDPPQEWWPTINYKGNGPLFLQTMTTLRQEKINPYLPGYRLVEIWGSRGYTSTMGHQVYLSGGPFRLVFKNGHISAPISIYLENIMRDEVVIEWDDYVLDNVRGGSYWLYWTEWYGDNSYTKFRCPLTVNQDKTYVIPGDVKKCEKIAYQ